MNQSERLTEEQINALPDWAREIDETEEIDVAQILCDQDKLLSAYAYALLALAELCEQVERSNAVDDHGHELKNLKALADARALLGGRKHGSV